MSTRPLERFVMFLYHYCLVTPTTAGYKYDTGTFTRTHKIKTGEDYKDLTVTLCDELDKVQGEFVITSLTLLHGE